MEVNLDCIKNIVLKNMKNWRNGNIIKNLNKEYNYTQNIKKIENKNQCFNNEKKKYL
jgi:hypothetical protein